MIKRVVIVYSSKERYNTPAAAMADAHLQLLEWLQAHQAQTIDVSAPTLAYSPYNQGSLQATVGVTVILEDGNS